MTAVCDWTVLELDGLTEKIDKAAGSVARSYVGAFDVEDLEQEGRIWAAEHAEEVRGLHERGDSLLSVRIWSRLSDKVSTESKRQQRNIGLHRLTEE